MEIRDGLEAEFMFGERKWSDGQRRSVFSCSDSRSTGVFYDMQIPASVIRLAFTLAAEIPLLKLLTRLEEFFQGVQG